MRYKSIVPPETAEIGDRHINPETGVESEWDGKQWASTPECDPVEDEDEPEEEASDKPAKAAAAAKKPKK